MSVNEPRSRGANSNHRGTHFNSKNARNFSGDNPNTRPKRDFSSKTSGPDAQNNKHRDKSEYSGKKTTVMLARHNRFDQSLERGRPPARNLIGSSSSAYHALGMDSSSKSNYPGPARNHSTTQQLSRSSFDSRLEEHRQVDDIVPASSPHSNRLGRSPASRMSQHASLRMPDTPMLM